MIEISFELIFRQQETRGAKEMPTGYPATKEKLKLSEKKRF